MTQPIRPDIHARFLSIYARAVEREEADWRAIIRGGTRELNRSWGRDGQALNGSKRGRVKRRRGVAIALEGFRPRSTGAFLDDGV